MQSESKQEISKTTESACESKKEFEPFQVATKLKAEIDRHCVAAYSEAPRWRLGASIIGHDCKRYLWYLFRWCKFEQLDGRQLRLMNRGNREEARFIEWLEGIGCKVWAFDEHGKQFRISGVMGHYGGSIDAVIELPEHFNFPYPLLTSFKTNQTGKGFNKLIAEGYAKAKPQHWAQECAYAYKMNLEYSAYLNINKNDDDLYIEVVKLDKRTGAQMEEKAELVIRSQTPPPRQSDNPTFHACTYCSMKDVCHEKAPIERNCRSCSYATPIENGEWFCSLPAHMQPIPRDFVKSLKGCEAWVSIVEVK